MGSTVRPSRICLVVDDEKRARSAIHRTLLGHFAKIYTAASAAEANAILESEMITHILCDHFLDDGSPQGTDLVSSWRTSYPGIERAVIITGADTSIIPRLPGVDSVLSKLTRPTDLLAAMGI